MRLSEYSILNHGEKWEHSLTMKVIRVFSLKSRREVGTLAHHEGNQSIHGGKWEHSLTMKVIRVFSLKSQREVGTLAHHEGNQSIQS